LLGVLSFFFLVFALTLEPDPGTFSIIIVIALAVSLVMLLVGLLHAFLGRRDPNKLNVPPPQAP
jgi:hypothetical protein